MKELANITLTQKVRRTTKEKYESLFYELKSKTPGLTRDDYINILVTSHIESKDKIQEDLQG